MARSRATKQMMSSSMNPKKWIQGAIDPGKKLEKAEHSKNSTIKKEANLAKTLKRFNR
jgi:hypothetical protein